MESHELPMIGKATERESELIDYLDNCIADWAEQHQTERRELICALFAMCVIAFTMQTHFDIEGQCQEIDHFCNYLKIKARE